MHNQAQCFPAISIHYSGLEESGNAVCFWPASLVLCHCGLIDLNFQFWQILTSFGRQVLLWLELDCCG